MKITLASTYPKATIQGLARMLFIPFRVKNITNYKQNTHFYFSKYTMLDS